MICPKCLIENPEDAVRCGCGFDFGLGKTPLYEREQAEQIKTWHSEEPGIVSQSFGVMLSPATWLIDKIIPQASIRGVLDFSNALAEWMADEKDILRDAGVSDLLELKKRDLRLSDDLADSVHNWAIGIGAGAGGATGAVGLPGIIVDIPTIITFALRTIHKIGLCYGYRVNTKEEKDFILAIMAAGSANEMSEKMAALSLLRSIGVTLAGQTWEGIARRAAVNRFSKEGGIIAVKTLAKQLGINLTKRKALQAIPAIGAVVGASANGWYIKEVGWAARRSFQERWLLDQ
ncbi:MAG: EcsC family protein [Nitrospiria bacterium]